jgi:cytochrome c553
MKKFLVFVLFCIPAFALAQVGEISTAIDPGPRGAPVAAGGFLPNLTGAQLAAAKDGATRFVETETVPGGLGPNYNSGSINACGECHSQPALGGSSPNINAYPYAGQNPEPTVDYDEAGATNYIPDFITPNGPAREVRFKYFLNPNGTLNTSAPDGGVHDLYTIAGRGDAAGCTLAQPAFAKNEALGNIAFRIPTPTFGDGLIEQIDDVTIIANQNKNAELKQALGINGVVNRSGNDGTITKFGWKAQNKSLLMFAGEAYNVEIGVTNELFNTERAEPGTELPAACKQNKTPEDTSNPGLSGPSVNSDITAFAAFMRTLAPPTPGPADASINRGRTLFTAVGCALCHTPYLVTAPSLEVSALSNVQANLFSDLLIHHMGSGLADGVSQGGAGPDQFRTAPLWGVGQRVFFLSDGRTSDLMEAIQQHASPGSEANQVINGFSRMSLQQKQDVINFLRSL